MRFQIMDADNRWRSRAVNGLANHKSSSIWKRASMLLIRDYHQVVYQMRMKVFDFRWNRDQLVSVTLIILLTWIRISIETHSRVFGPFVNMVDHKPGRTFAQYNRIMYLFGVVDWKKMHIWALVGVKPVIEKLVSGKSHPTQIRYDSLSRNSTYLYDVFRVKTYHFLELFVLHCEISSFAEWSISPSPRLSASDSSNGKNVPQGHFWLARYLCRVGAAISGPKRAYKRSKAIVWDWIDSESSSRRTTTIRPAWRRSFGDWKSVQSPLRRRELCITAASALKARILCFNTREFDSPRWVSI